MALAYSGHIICAEFGAPTRGALVELATAYLVQALWEIDETLQASLTSSAIPGNYSDGDTITLGDRTYTVKATLTGVANQVLRGGSLAVTLVNLKAAVNGEAGSGTIYTAATLPHTAIEITGTTTNTVSLRSRSRGPSGSGVSTSYGTLTGGGYILRGRSPQVGRQDPGEELTVLLKITNDLTGGFPFPERVNLQMISDVDPLDASALHELEVGDEIEYRIHFNPCQFFFWRRGIIGSEWGSTLAGGIPWIPLDTVTCQGEVPAEPVTEAWWIVGDSSGEANPRVALMGGGPTRNAEPPNFAQCCWNGSMCHADEDQPGNWQILAIKSLQHWKTLPVGYVVSKSIWHDGTSLQFEPLVAWGLTHAHAPRVRGQIWDAWLTSVQQEVETEVTYAGNPYVNYTDGYYWGALQLRLTEEAPIDVAYAH